MDNNLAHVANTMARAIASGEIPILSMLSRIWPGAFIVGDPETVAEKILRLNASLGEISRLTFQMSVAALPHAKLMHAIELLGTRVAPLVQKELAYSNERAA
jgi:alkanesulfonate monooxygenase SsuD/methylene tetrahydromethanopterin reductase-like flavin-dependent oxidoreductase (luciferase family)